MGTSFSCGMARTIFLCLLMNYISAAPVCKTSLKFNQVGLCSSNGSVEIWDCAACQPGLGQSVECGQNYKQGTKVGCEPCTTGTYSDTYDISQCKKCTLCQKNEIKSGRCTSFEDSITCTCKSGYYRDTHTRACKQCSWCCGDKSNEYVPECNVLQVPPGKRCSFQTVKSCAPTTPAPTTIATSPSTNLPTTGISSSSSSAPRTIEKTTITKKDNTKKSSNSLLPTKVLNDPEITKDPPEGESWLKDWVKTLVLSVVSIAACFIACIFITLYCFHKKRKGQSLLEGNNRENNSNGSSPEERVHLNPSAATAAYHVPQGPNGVEPPQANACQSGNQGKMKHSQKPKEISLELKPMMPSVKQPEHNSDEEDPLLTATGNQVKVEDSAPGPSTDESVPVVTINTPNIENGTEKLGQLSKEQKLDMPVTQLPFEIYSKVCTRLDTEDPFFYDYRMLAEELGVIKEDMDDLKTNSLLLKHKPKVRKLIEILEKTKKEYLIEAIEAWLNQC